MLKTCLKFLTIFSHLHFVSNGSFQTELEEAGYSVGLLLKIPKAMMDQYQLPSFLSTSSPKKDIRISRINSSYQMLISIRFD